ncbi:OB-fold protein [Corynebacterium pseudopelargi]|uniref:tRNA_anti-like protein n=1 Tax=Corynebacterium pseudopelargi TaxID=2080757 RepID=A0A3G6IXA5_9CORY|nr:hypothetical protein [Corynebacterium pseudopelargi]AZA10276.1 tRNA_anti-like protein [Corynebacterium pseudopelargi]
MYSASQEPKIPPYKKKGFWLIAAPVLVFFVMLMGGNKDVDSDKASKTEAALATAEAQVNQDPSAEPVSVEEAIIPVTADELIAEYSSNELRADEKWKGKTLEVSGVVRNVTDILRSKAVNIEGTDSWDLHFVSCELDPEDLESAKMLNKGDQVTVRGKNSGYNQVSVNIDHCEILGVPAAQ